MLVRKQHQARTKYQGINKEYFFKKRISVITWILGVIDSKDYRRANNNFDGYKELIDKREKILNNIKYL